MIRTLASLRFAVVLVVALAFAMALASFHETQHGTESALNVYYGSWWFAALLAALGVNALASLIVRWPWRRTHIGFLIVHIAVLAVLVGALVTRIGSVHGRIWLRPNETRSDFDGETWVVSLDAVEGQDHAEIPIGYGGPGLLGSERVGPADGVTMTLEEFALDTIDEGERVLADPNARQAAVRLDVVVGGHAHELSLMSGQPMRMGTLTLRLFRVPNAAMLERLLEPTAPPTDRPKGTIVATLHEGRYAVDVGEHLGETVPLGGTGYKIKVLRYLPHAMVSGREIRSATSQPVNPMIEFELIEPSGKTSLHRIFARFPDQDFAGEHGDPAKLTTRTAAEPTTRPVRFRYEEAFVREQRRNSIDLLLDAQNRLYARFSDEEGRITSTAVKLNTPIKTPWPETSLTAKEILPHARSERALKPIPRRKEGALPAAFIRLEAGDLTYRLWVRKGERFDVNLGRKHVRVGFVPVRVPLGFSITLLEPRITYYPGTESARTYESRVRIEEEDGTTLEQTISMNEPLCHGGYSFYQSSYQFGQQGEPVASMLSVVSDPGEPIVYAGYYGLMFGMAVILVQRIRRRQRRLAIRAEE